MYLSNQSKVEGEHKPLIVVWKYLEIITSDKALNYRFNNWDKRYFGIRDTLGYNYIIGVLI
jgi:hypothetical protein